MNDKKYIDDLVTYIKKNLKKGYTKDSLRWALVDQGYSRLEVDKALKVVDQELAQEAPVLKVKPEIHHEFISTDEPVKKSFWKKIFGG